MTPEIFTLCDSAADYSGKLCILGTFDSFFTPQVPMVVPAFSIAIRLRVQKTEEGEHPFKLSVINDDGQNVIAPIAGKFGVQITPGSRSGGVNLVINMQTTQFKNLGSYQADLTVDGQQIAAIPLYVRKPA